MVKSLIKKITPIFLLNCYHKSLALLAMLIFNNPSKKLIVIGVTGTNGKSTTVNIIAEILEEAGYKTGLTSTTNFKIGGQDKLNDQKMTMMGRFKTQKFLKRMVKESCAYAIIETSSEGIKQCRHLGINYDLAVFTNLTPEHIESHGSFEKYKEAKGKLFKHLTARKIKTINGKKIPKIIIANKDDRYFEYFNSFEANRKISYSINQGSDLQATEIRLQSNGTTFAVNDESFKTNLLGKVNIYNCLASMAVCQTQAVSWEEMRQALLKYQGLAGRFEFIDQGQDFQVMVDYAPEPESMKRLYETLKIFNFNKIIHVLGSCGGGRDTARRPILGEIAGRNAQVNIITNEDPYDDDPQMIIDQVAEGSLKTGKVLDQNLFKIIDRKEAIKKALDLAEENDLVLITGKGCEQYICVKDGQKIPWDDREVVKELLNS